VPEMLSAGVPEALSAGVPEMLSAGVPEALSAGVPEMLSAGGQVTARPVTGAPGWPAPPNRRPRQVAAGNAHIRRPISEIRSGPSPTYHGSGTGISDK
jgi:hypothetical protein